MGAELISAGTLLGPTEWLVVGQERIDAFGVATEDRRSIHVTPELAAAGPYGTPVAHGFLTLALIAHFWDEVAPDGRLTVNYGLNRVRFPAPVPAGSRVRCRFAVDSVSEHPRGLHTVVTATVEREGAAEPACVAEVVFLLVAPPAAAI